MIHKYCYCPACLYSCLYEPEKTCAFCKSKMVYTNEIYNTDSMITFQNDPEHKKDPRFSQEAYEKRINWVPVKMYSAPNGGAKCISCGSSNIKKISVASKVGSVALWGVFAAGRTSKRYHCNNCGTEF